VFEPGRNADGKKSIELFVQPDKIILIICYFFISMQQIILPSVFIPEMNKKTK